MSEQLPPVSSPAPTGDKKGLAIASLVLGILSLCGSGFLFCGGILSIIGIVLGILGINTKGKAMAIAGIVLSAIGLLLAIVLRVIFRGAVFNNIWQQFLTNRGY